MAHWPLYLKRRVAYRARFGYVSQIAALLASQVPRILRPKSAGTSLVSKTTMPINRRAGFLARLQTQCFRQLPDSMSTFYPYFYLHGERLQSTKEEPLLRIIFRAFASEVRFPTLRRTSPPPPTSNSRQPDPTNRYLGIIRWFGLSDFHINPFNNTNTG